MKNIQNKAIENAPKINSLGGFDVFEWKPSSLHISMEDNLKIPLEIKRIEKISDDFSIISSYEQYEQFEQSISFIKKILFGISGVLLVLLVSVLFFVFFLINNSRKLEVGILKALGFRTNTILHMYINELLRYGRNISIISLFFNVLITIILIALLNLSLKSSISFVIIFLVWTIILSNLIILLSGIFPIYKACKETVIDTIRLNR